MLNLAEQAAADLQASPPGGVRLPDYVVSELVYVLEFHTQLAYDRREIAEGLGIILAHAACQCDRDLHKRALELYEAGKLDYVDCLVIAEHQLGRANKVLS